jgi:hypothetical protein
MIEKIERVVRRATYHTKKGAVELVWRVVVDKSGGTRHEVVSYTGSATKPYHHTSRATRETDKATADRTWTKEFRKLSKKGVLADQFSPPKDEPQAGFAMSRFDALNLTDAERDFQEKRWPGHKHSVTEFLVYMQDYVTEALNLYSRNDNASVDEICKANVRKIAALALACMEQNGAPERRTA